MVSKNKLIIHTGAAVGLFFIGLNDSTSILFFSGAGLLGNARMFRYASGLSRPATRGETQVVLLLSLFYHIMAQKGTEKTLQKLKDSISNGNYYEAHQMYRTVARR